MMADTIPVSLADLIREGARLAPHYPGPKVLSRTRQAEQRGTTCALTAMHHAATGSPMGVLNFQDNLDCLPVACPLCERPRLSSVNFFLVHLNDEHEMTREQVADVLDATLFIQPFAWVPRERPWLTPKESP